MSRRNPPELVVPITVEFEDVDSYRIVHHTKLVAYLERARLRLLAKLGMDLSREDLVPVLYDLRMRFRQPARLMDRLEVEVTVKGFHEYQLELGYRIRRDGETIARATSIIAFADLASGEVAPLPKEYLEVLGTLLAERGLSS
jgi:YbgC/YbaW family acyl-CoA thioester hydrolase